MQNYYQVIVSLENKEKIIQIECERKKRKNIILKVYPKTARVLLSMPKNTPEAYVNKFLDKQRSWLEKQLKSILPYISEHNYLTGDIFYYLGKPLQLLIVDSNCNKVEIQDDKIILMQKLELSVEQKTKLLEKMFNDKANTIFKDSVQRMSNVFQPLINLAEQPTIKLRKMTSKWGICRPFIKEITLSKRLIHLDLSLIDYVVAHELCHFKHMNHSRDFWDFLAQVMPDYKQRRLLLNKSDVYMTNY